ncbi:MAG: DEAD/DEAH box helicase [Bacteriovoracaceae bacterium]|nr:DEAD/DEAH box helicase [Bacteriovoracaceae bacterium]
MVNFIDVIDDGELLVFLAPTGSGKTHFILNSLSKGGRRIVFVSPLKALALEFYEKSKKRSLLLCGEKNKGEKLKEKWDFLVATPESLGSRELESLSMMVPKPVVILDEIHLFLKWGSSFRPRLLDFIEALGVMTFPCLGLTATLDERSKNWINEQLNLGFLARIVDFGNMGIKYSPKNNYYFPNWAKKIFHQYFIYKMKNTNGIALFFCRTRTEVFNWVELFEWLQIDCLGCVGGETNAFLESYKQKKSVRAIFATSALSHGVNLGEISEVFIGYKVLEKDIWVQMVSRGGRMNNSFELYSFEKFKIATKAEFFIAILLKTVWSRLRVYFLV